MNFAEHKGNGVECSTLHGSVNRDPTTIAMASKNGCDGLETIVAMASTLVVMASNPIAMASTVCSVLVARFQCFSHLNAGLF